jgi:hypothetical protein
VYPYAHGYGDQRHVSEGATDDREAEPDEHNVGWESQGAQLRLDAGSDDLEPALGRTEALDQRPQRAGSGHEDEPTMGSLDRRDQTGWAHNHDASDSEREEVSEDGGAQDDREAYLPPLSPQPAPCDQRSEAFGAVAMIIVSPFRNELSACNFCSFCRCPEA